MKGSDLQIQPVHNQNSMSRKPMLATAMIAASALGLVACGSGSNSGSEGTSNLSMSMTDAPVSGVTSLVLHVDRVEMKSGDETLSFAVDSEFDLLTLQGAQSADLFVDQEVPAGDYQWVRLYVDTTQSYLMTESGGSAEYSFEIPSNDQTGLKLNSPFTLPADQTVAFVIDFDVAKSLTLANGEYKLRPTLRIEDLAAVGHIEGTVAAEALTDCEVPKVYAFEGSTAAFSDINITSGSDSGPVTTSLVSYNELSTNYEYELGFLPAGDYSLYMICDEDDPELDDEIEPVISDTATVEANSSISVNLAVTIEI